MSSQRVTPSQDAHATENPYASHTFAEPLLDRDQLLSATSKLYRRMGWCGVAYLFVSGTVATVSELAHRRPPLGEVMAMAGVCGLLLLFFSLMIMVGKQLHVDFDGAYRRARWLGILAGALFFPLLTFPAVLAVRRLARCGEIETLFSSARRSGG